MPLAVEIREAHRDLLLKLTQLPTAAGREFRVVKFISDWVNARPAMQLHTDATGNLTVTLRDSVTGGRPVYFTAHLDHPAFVVERIIAPGVLELSFRGGVMDDYFVNAKVAVFDSVDKRHAGVLKGKCEAPAVGGRANPFTYYTCELHDTKAAESVEVGDVCVWDLPAAQITDGIVHTHACDDLAAAAAALAAFDVLSGLVAGERQDVRLLFTRAEEIGFIGAIAATRDGTMPKEARVIALENSRSFPHDSPINGGPIVRVGDRISVFTPSLTDAIAKRAEEIAGGPASPTASQKNSTLPAWKWQRKLMAGGACEASVFCAAGYEATCVCLPLGNYHNMGDLTAVQAGTNTRPATIEREQIGLADYEGLVDLLIACGVTLGSGNSMHSLVEKLWGERKFVLGV
jgi:endoglucanase